jgi:hypothetical protein
MPRQQTPQVTPPLKTYTKLLVGIAVLIVLMFAMIAAITIHLADKKP